MRAFSCIFNVQSLDYGNIEYSERAEPLNIEIKNIEFFKEFGSPMGDASSPPHSDESF